MILASKPTLEYGIVLCKFYWQNNSTTTEMIMVSMEYCPHFHAAVQIKEVGMISFLLILQLQNM